jgi:tRNA-dihydrouridine synthase B
MAALFASRPPAKLVIQIGSHTLTSPVLLAPMAGVSDRPFRDSVRRFGIGLAVGEMVASNPDTWKTRKSELRRANRDEQGIRSVQIVGWDPQMMADAARFNVDEGAEIIDINMGCPAKKVCNRAAGSALLRDEQLVVSILNAVVNAVDVPVTLKIRTGWCRESRNALVIGRIAESEGVRLLTVHGRTRADKFEGEAEYETIAELARSLTIPVIANGDIDSPEKAKAVLDSTGAAGIMVGRAAQGRPWLGFQIDHFLNTGTMPPPPALTIIQSVMMDHLNALHACYGNQLGVRIARKHMGWYLKASNVDPTLSKTFLHNFNCLDTASEQVGALERFFHDWASRNWQVMNEGYVA